MEYAVVKASLAFLRFTPEAGAVIEDEVLFGMAAAPALASDHLADVLGMDAHLKGAGTAPVRVRDPDVVRVGDQTAHQMLQGVGEHAQASSASAAGCA